jgi:hypothetical protein
MGRLGPILAAMLVSAAMGGVACRKASAPRASTRPVHEACVLAPERCERLCQGCDDRDDCFYRGGECLRRQGTVIFKKDDHDSGDDVFSGGCHYQCTDAACTKDETFLAGDACLNDVKIAEWTQSRCHDSCLSVYDCDGECRRLGKGRGVCATLPDHCGLGRASAACKCAEHEGVSPLVGSPR